MHQPTTQARTNCIQFCKQDALCDNLPYSREQLHSVLERIYTERAPFTGYLKFACTASEDCCQLFLFFFKGAPYAAGRYATGKPVIYSVQDLARQLVKSDHSAVLVTLCETDPVLLKCILLFLQKEPAVKAPTTLIDFESIVQQIGEAGEHTMISLCRENSCNFFFFKAGRCAQVYYADQAFERPRGMTLDEEMLLYAYQPGEPVLTYIYRDMNTSMSEDSNQYDKEPLYTLLTVGYLKNKRKDDQDSSPNEETGDGEAAAKPLQHTTAPVQITLLFESGPLQGTEHTVTLPCTIGRTECALILDDRLVSRRHAELKFVENTVVIEDLASKNGTKVNGTKITSSSLAPNDLISIGPFHLRITSGTK